MRKLLFLALIAIPILSFGQVPDMAAIEKNINDQSSEYYYPNMLNRYLMADSTLTLENYHHLYYGYIFSENYDLTKTSAKPLSLSVFEKKGIPTPDDYKRVITDLNRTLLKDPFNLQFLNLLTFCYSAIGDKENEFLSSRRFKMVMAAIFSSGTGITENLPICVIYRSHIEDFMIYMNKLYRKPEMTSSYTEYVPLVTKDGGISGYYFKIMVRK